MDWKIRAADGSEQVQRLEQIQVSAKHGRVKPDSYVFNPVTEQWRYGREIEELRAYWPVAAVTVTPPIAQQATAAKSMCGVAVALFLFSVALGMLNMGKALSLLLVAAAVLCGIVGTIFYALKK